MDIKTGISLDLTQSADMVADNLLNSPTKTIGETINNILFLIFGEFNHGINKRRLLYQTDYELFEHEIKKQISHISEDNQKEADFYTIAHIIENSKFSIGSDEIRKMFACLIAASIDSQKSDNVHPAFSDIIRQMTPLDAKLLEFVFKKKKRPIIRLFWGHEIKTENFGFTSGRVGAIIAQHIISPKDFPQDEYKVIQLSFENLLRLNLVDITYNQRINEPSLYEDIESCYREQIDELMLQPDKNQEDIIIIDKGIVSLNCFGDIFCDVCLSEA